MKTITVNLYQYDELSDEAKERVLNDLSDINVDYEWWDFIYDDAERAGIKITSFDLYRRTIDGELTMSGRDSARAIIEQHGRSCDSWKLAANYLYVLPREGYPFDEDEYLHDTLEDYLSILRREYEDLLSREAVEETIRANEYWFTGDGKIL